MDDEEIAHRISELTDEQRNALYQLCAARHNQPGPKVVVYLPIDAEIAQALHDRELVWLLIIGQIQAGARDDVYNYWKKLN
jgi:hypothetical protein